MKIVVAGATGTVGRHVVATAHSRGHDVVPLSRSSGQDVVTGKGLRDAMSGAHAVIDVSGEVTTSASKAKTFATAASRNLLDAEIAAGAGHHIALSIVGIDKIDTGYYAGKLAQEQVVSSGRVPWSIVRTAQFHEFAQQVLAVGKVGPLYLIPKILLRPVAAREVAARLVDVAEHEPAGRVSDFVGPADERLVELVRRMSVHDGTGRPTIEVRLPGKYWRACASGVLRGDGDAVRAEITFDQWLHSADHTQVTQ